MDPASKSKNGLANHFGRAIELRCRALSVSAATGSNLSELVKRAPEMDNGNDHRPCIETVWCYGNTRMQTMWSLSITTTQFNRKTRFFGLAPRVL